MLAELARILVLVAPLAPSIANAAVTWTAEPLNPPAVPLAVRTPYLSAWLQQGSGQPLNGAWPSFWTGMVCAEAFFYTATNSESIVYRQTLGWAGFIRVDGLAYNFLGDPSLGSGVLKATQKSFKVCPIFTAYSLKPCPFRKPPFYQDRVIFPRRNIFGVSNSWS